MVGIKKLLNHKIGILMAEPEVVISRQGNSAVMYPNKSITVVAMDVYILAMDSTLISVFACEVAFHFNVCIESYIFLKMACGE